MRGGSKEKTERERAGDERGGADQNTLGDFHNCWFA